MSKRRLTQQQKRRIAAKQEKIKSLSEMEINFEDQKPGLVIAHYGKFLDVEDEQGAIHRCNIRQNLENIVAGDRIFWVAGADNTGVVVALNERKTLLWRMDAYHKKKSLAANIDQIMIVCAPKPKPSFLLMDSLLVAAEILRIVPVLLINKMDILSEVNQPELFEMLTYYKKLGYQFIETSCKELHGLDALILQLNHHTSIFVGQSGVGKSSLINAIMPEANLGVGNLVELSELGAHTTTTSRLFHLSSGGDLIDSPGIREFTLWEEEPQTIAAAFKDFQPYLGLCKFNNCKHINEPECEIIIQVSEEKIHSSRYKNYLALINKNL